MGKTGTYLCVMGIILGALCLAVGRWSQAGARILARMIGSSDDREKTKQRSSNAISISSFLRRGEVTYMYVNYFTVRRCS